MTMTQTITIDTLYRRFLSLCDAYAANPELLTGLTLDEVAGQLKQACATELQDPVMHELLQRLLRSIPRGDVAEFHRLLDGIRAAALEHGLT